MSPLARLIVLAMLLVVAVITVGLALLGGVR